MKKFNVDDALKGAPVKLKNGLKAYIKKYREDNVFVYSGYVAGGRGEVRSWNRQGKEYFNYESQYDIVSMWEDQELETNLETAKENIFEKALKETIVRVKQNSIEYHLKNMAPTDMAALQKLMADKKSLERWRAGELPDFAF